jgi:hypothetical protein
MPLLERPFAALYDRLTAPQERQWLGEARRQLHPALPVGCWKSVRAPGPISSIIHPRPGDRY